MVEEALDPASRGPMVCLGGEDDRESLALLEPFERPRRAYELKATPAFGELSYTVWSQLRDEVMRARAAEDVAP